MVGPCIRAVELPFLERSAPFSSVSGKQLFWCFFALFSGEEILDYDT